MFVFVGGIQPEVNSKTVDLVCPLCSRPTTQEKRIDQVLSLFFIPLLTVHRGAPYRVCPSCGWDSRKAQGWQLGRPSDDYVPEQPHTHPTNPPDDAPLSCTHCGNPIQEQYLFCPFCGTFLKD